MKKTSKRTGGSQRRSPGRRRRSRILPHEAALVAFATVAEDLGLRWYVFGAQAVSLHGFPRATADVDITVELGSQPVTSFITELKRAGFEPRFPDEDFVAATRVIPVVHRSSALALDLVLAGPGLEEIFLQEVELHQVATARVPVLSVENLIVTKVLAGRPRDREDVREILKVREVDHAKVVALLEAIESALGQSDLCPLYTQLRRDADLRHG